HYSTSHKYAAFERIGSLALGLPGESRKQLVLAKLNVMPGIEQHKAASTIGVFSTAHLKTGLAKECGLLIPQNSGNGNIGPKSARSSVSDIAIRRNNFR